jgi:hypothetical protein
MAGFDLSGYVTVSERLVAALTKWPELRVVESAPEIVTIGDHVYLSVEMTVYRTPDDPIPCVARAWERFPGATPYTKNAEMMNASTSALGRCLGLMGLGISKSIASADEVALAESRRQEPPRAPVGSRAARPAPAAPETPTDGLSAGLRRLIAAKAERLGVPVPELADKAAADEWLAAHEIGAEP